jgi:hypothetical protein
MLSKYMLKIQSPAEVVQSSPRFHNNAPLLLHNICLQATRGLSLIPQPPTFPQRLSHSWLYYQPPAVCRYIEHRITKIVARWSSRLHCMYAIDRHRARLQHGRKQSGTQNDTALACFDSADSKVCVGSYHCSISQACSPLVVIPLQYLLSIDCKYEVHPREYCGVAACVGRTRLCSISFYSRRCHCARLQVW